MGKLATDENTKKVLIEDITNLENDIDWYFDKLIWEWWFKWIDDEN